MKHIWNKVTLDKVYVFILLMIFGGIVLQAPISVGFGTLWPHYNLVIKAWAEILMAIASGMLLILLYKKRQFGLLKDPLLIICYIYTALHLLLLPVFWRGGSATIAGLIIDLRYIVFFGLVYVALKLYPGSRKTFVQIGVAGALIVTFFAILQLTVLPVDVLKYIGYNTHTIVPYLTVDQNQSYIRINSTLRGPNPVGAYALISLTLLLAALLKKPVITSKKRLIMAVLAIGGIAALWASYSRSALLATVVALILVFIVANLKNVPKRIWGIGAVLLTIVILAGFMFSGSKFISNIVLHDNPDGGSAAKSDEGHIASLQGGLKLFSTQPLGNGVGSTGSASLTSKSPLIIENQYLFVAHESGWLGLALFLGVFLRLLNKLWARRQDWLALGVFASGVGLAIIGLLLPVWVDDTISIVWWGLAGIALGAIYERR